MQRVLVIGSPGSGKSTLATELSRTTGLPLVHLDQEHWRPGWIEPPRDEWQRQVTEIVGRDRWIIDGNYSGSLELRLGRADTVIDLEFPAWLCVWRIVRRVATSWRKVRPDMAEGCPEQVNLEFLVYVATFPRRARKRTDAKLAGFRGTRVTLRSPAEVRRFLARIGKGG
ncbi:MAG: topology modulation protein [Sphingomicrobium sp.]